jgi:predicted RND superfamily exporter protein
MTESSSDKKKGISVLQRLGLLAIIGIVLAVIFSYLR